MKPPCGCGFHSIGKMARRQWRETVARKSQRKFSNSCSRLQSDLPSFIRSKIRDCLARLDIAAGFMMNKRRQCKPLPKPGRNSSWCRLNNGSNWSLAISHHFRAPTLMGMSRQWNTLAFQSQARQIILERTALGLSQAELARRAGVRVETLNRIERAKVTADTATIAKIDKALHPKAATRIVRRSRAS